MQKKRITRNLKPTRQAERPIRMPRTKQEAYELFVKPNLESIKTIAHRYKPKGVEASDVIQITSIKVLENLLE